MPQEEKFQINEKKKFLERKLKGKICNENFEGNLCERELLINLREMRKREKE